MVCVNHLFSAHGRAALRKLADSNGGTLLAFDFDGTLAPIVAMPAMAVMSHEVSKRFREICLLTNVAVITGRSVDDLRLRLDGAVPAYVIGNHGIQGLPGSNATQLQSMAVLCEDWEQQCAEALMLQGLTPAVFLENKHYSLCVHYRHAYNIEATRETLNAIFVGMHPLPAVMEGKFCFNLLPPGAPTKADALSALVELAGVSATFYVGDDETDEFVFRRATPNWMTVKVGEEKDTAAQFHLTHQEQMAACLDLLLSMLSSKPAAHALTADIIC